MKRGIVKASKGRYIGGVRDKSAPTDVQIILLMAIIDACRSPEEMQEAVLAAVSRNEEWRGKRCLNLLAPEALTSPTVRGLLSAEVGTRAAEGHIGPINRW